MSASGIPPGGSAAFQEALRKLAVEFERALPQRLADATQLLRRCREHPQDPQPLEELFRTMHTLAGSAATFGQRALGDRAREIEHALAALRGDGQRTTASFEEVTALLQALCDGAAAP